MITIKPNSFYKETSKGYIFYMETDGENVYDIILYNKELHHVSRFNPKQFFTSITDFSLRRNITLKEVSKEEIESDLLLEMI